MVGAEFVCLTDIDQSERFTQTVFRNIHDNLHIQPNPRFNCSFSPLAWSKTSTLLPALDQLFVPIPCPFCPEQNDRSKQSPTTHPLVLLASDVMYDIELFFSRSIFPFLLRYFHTHIDELIATISTYLHIAPSSSSSPSSEPEGPSVETARKWFCENSFCLLVNHWSRFSHCEQAFSEMLEVNGLKNSTDMWMYASKGSSPSASTERTLWMASTDGEVVSIPRPQLNITGQSSSHPYAFYCITVKP